jgi:hypothetical protein
MRTSCSLFVQILKVIPRSLFEQLVRKHRSERHARGFTSWQQTVSMMFCQFGRAQSLREIEHGLRSAEGKLNHLGIEAPSRSTLSYANAHRPWELYRDLFFELFKLCETAKPGRHRFRFKNPLVSIDSTTVELVSEMFAWAKYSKSKGAIKLHLMLDHDGYLPRFAVVTDGQSADVTVGRTFSFEPGTVVVFDRGYIDYEWFRSLGEQGVFFVTRLKKNANFEVVEDRPVPTNSNVVSDQRVNVLMSGRPSFPPLPLRRVEVIDPEGGENLVFFTNQFSFAARTVAAIYKERWQIELFFKALKQNLKIKTFIGTSSNAIHIQLWTALIAMLLVRYLQLKSKCALSLSNLFALLRFHLFAHHDLWTWLKSPFADPQHSPPAQQLSLL